MSRLAAILALVAIAGSPAVAHARFVCRYSGLEIADCEQQRAPASPVIESEPCCERTAVRTLAPALVAPADAPVVPPAGPAVALLPPPPAPGPTARHTPPRRSTAGPPLYVAQRALLI